MLDSTEYMPGIRSHAQRRLRFHEMWDAHYPRVLGYARRRRPDDAYDVASETFLVAWRRLDQVPVEDPLPWLIGTARRLIANHSRGERRRTALLARLRGLPVEVGPDPSEIAAASGLREAFAQLTPTEREVIALASWEGLTHLQISAVLGCSPAAVAVRLHRARARLKGTLAETSDGPLLSQPKPATDGEGR